MKIEILKCFLLSMHRQARGQGGPREDLAFRRKHRSNIIVRSNLQHGPSLCIFKVDQCLCVVASYSDQYAHLAHMLLTDLYGCAGGTMTAAMTLLAKEEGVTGIKAEVRNHRILWVL